MRSFIIAMLLACLAGNSFAQTGHLLWYKGKLLRKNVLLTPEGDTVFYTPSKGILRVSANKKTENRTHRMKLELDKTDKRIMETVQRLSSELPKPVLPLVARQVRYGYEMVQKQYEAALDSKMMLPEMRIPVQERPVKGPGYYEDNVDILKIISDSLSRLEEYMEAHKGDVFTSVPVPPRQNFSYCAPCQPGIEENYKREMSRMERELAGDDFDMMQLAFGISRAAALFLGDSEDGLRIQSACARVFDFIMVRYNRKIRLLYNRYGEDPYRLAAVLQMILSIDRQNQLLGCSEPMDTDIHDMVKYTYVKFLHKALDEKDYSIALNLQLILSFSRTCQLMLGSFETDVEVVERALKFNRFKMDIHISGKIGAEDGYQLAELKASNWFMAIPDSSCRLQWYLVEPLINKMQAEIVASDWRGRGVVITYAGPKKWNSAVPKMRLDFCKKDDAVKDTVDIYQFDAEGFDEKWNIPKMGVTKLLAMNNPLMNCFIDIDQVKRQAEELKSDPKAIEKMQKEMMARYQQMAKNNQLQSVSAGDQLNWQNMEAIVKMQQAGREITDMIYRPAPNKYHFEPKLHNKEKIIVNEKLNGKELFPGNAATQYAWFFLSIEHDPNGPLGSFF